MFEISRDEEPLDKITDKHVTRGGGGGGVVRGERGGRSISILSTACLRLASVACIYTQEWLG